MSLADHLDEAANYIKNLEKHLEKLRQKKDCLVAIAKQNIASISCKANGGLRPPQIEVHEMGSALTVVLVTGLNHKFMFNETIRVLHEEGAEIVYAGFSIVDDTVFHTIHSKVATFLLFIIVLINVYFKIVTFDFEFVMHLNMQQYCQFF